MKRISFVVLAAASIAAGGGAADATAATTIGAVAPSYASVGGCPNCNALQGSSTAYSYNIPSDGVITSFAVRTSTTAPTSDDEITYFAARYAGGPNYLMVYRSAFLSYAGKPADAVVSFPVQASVKAGDFTGMSWSTNSIDGLVSESGAVGYTANAESTPVGSTFTLQPGSFASRLNLRLVLEPDLDHDGYGDETQDLCPSNAQVHTTCPGASNPLDSVAPLISSLKSNNAKFRIDSKGAVVAAKPKKGSTISFTSSEAATVTFKVYRGSKRTQTFVRAAKAGSNLVKYSGRYRDAKKKKRSLTVGKYLLTATPVDAAGNVGVTQSASFKIVK